MNFGEALEILNQGGKVKVPEWKGYWFKEAGMIKVMTAEGQVLETPHFQQYIFRTDWEQADSFVDRIKKEKADLEHKVQKLSAFLDLDRPETVSIYHHNLLRIQLENMNSYLIVLEERIADLEK